MSRDSGYTVNEDDYRLNEGGGRMPEPKTFKEAAEEMVAKSADVIRWRTFATPEHLPPHEMRLRLWDTDEGRALRKAVQMWGDLEVSDVATQIRKGKADEVLAAGYAVLRKGLMPQAQPEDR